MSGLVRGFDGQEAPMKNLSTTIATYDDEQAAERDWEAVEASANTGLLDLADAALVKRDEAGEITIVHRQSHHGWGKGAVAGAVVGLLFPPSIIAGAAVGAGGGGVIARLNRSLDRGDIKDLGDVMDSGEIAFVVLTAEDSVGDLRNLLLGAAKTLTRSSSTAEEVRAALDAESATG
jgi:uncharacterized membrane protein